jgi:hypothetical protein
LLHEECKEPIVGERQEGGQRERREKKQRGHKVGRGLNQGRVELTSASAWPALSSEDGLRGLRKNPSGRGKKKKRRRRRRRRKKNRKERREGRY